VPDHAHLKPGHRQTRGIVSVKSEDPFIAKRGEAVVFDLLHELAAVKL